MPYKDPEKKKQWERKNRGKGTSHAIWWGYLYFDSSPEDWEQRIKKAPASLAAAGSFPAAALAALAAGRGDATPSKPS